MRATVSHLPFNHYQKYVDMDDINVIGIQHHFEMTIHHFGRTFCAFSGK